MSRSLRPARECSRTQAALVAQGAAAGRLGSAARADSLDLAALCPCFGSGELLTAFAGFVRCPSRRRRQTSFRGHAGRLCVEDSSRCIESVEPLAEKLMKNRPRLCVLLGAASDAVRGAAFRPGDLGRHRLLGRHRRRRDWRSRWLWCLGAVATHELMKTTAIRNCQRSARFIFLLFALCSLRVAGWKVFGTSVGELWALGSVGRGALGGSDFRPPTSDLRPPSRKPRNLAETRRDSPRVTESCVFPAIRDQASTTFLRRPRGGFRVASAAGALGGI